MSVHLRSPLVTIRLPSGDGFKCVHVLSFISLIPAVSRHFQCGVSNFLLGRYDLALLNFEDAYLYLRGNEAMSVLINLFYPELIIP